MSMEAPAGQDGVVMIFDVDGLLSLCGARVDIPDKNQKFYAIYVETTTQPRIRVMSFNTECNQGGFRSVFVRFPPGTPVIPYFFEPITFEIIMEADDGISDFNVNPFADFELRGED